MFKNLKKEIKEIKQSASAKINQTLHTGTSDRDFETMREQFISSKKRFKGLQKSIIQFLAAAQAMTASQEMISKSVNTIMGENTSVVGVTNAFTHELDRNSKILEGALKIDLVGIIDHYLIQYVELEKRIDERYRRLSMMDKAEKDLKAMQQKSASISGIRTDDHHNNWVTLKESYEALNEEIKNDITLLLNDSRPFLDLLFPLVATAQMKYFAACANSSQCLAQMASHVEVDRVKNYPQMIMPYNTSVMYCRPGRQELPAHPSSTFTTQTTQQISGPQTVQQSTPIYGQKDVGKAQQHVPTGLPMPPANRGIATALYDFDGTVESDLRFRAGDSLVLLETEGEWWLAELNGKRGYIPHNFVRLR